MNDRVYTLVYTALQADNEVDYAAAIRATESLDTRGQAEFWAALHNLALGYEEGSDVEGGDADYVGTI